MPFEMNCANCGGALKITEWGPNRICPSCGKNTVNVDIREVHVLFGDKYSQSFEYFIKDEMLDAVLQRSRKSKDLHPGVDYHKIRLYYELCIGNISNPPYSNANYYAHYSGSPEVAVARRDRALEKLESVDDTVPVYLWLSNNEANEFMNLLYFAKSFERFENVYLVKWNHTEKDFDGAKFTMLKALERKRKLSLKEPDEFYSRFIEIQKWNSEYLIGDSDKVEPWSYSKVEEYVLSCMTNRYRTLGSIYSAVLKAVKKDCSFYIDYRMVEEAVHRLMMIGKIKSHGACMWWGESCYNNMICTQSFRITNRQHQTLTYNEVLEVICDAFEFGYTYPLYDLLNDDSILVSTEKTITGRWGIIEYIENDGAYRVLSCNQKVECNITKVEEGNGYQKDDVYIFLKYEKEESNEYWLVKVLFDDNIIHSIEVSMPKEGLKLIAEE